MDRQIIFRCPQTGMNVQYRLAAAPADGTNTHVSVACPACTRLHFINRSTGQILGEKRRRD
ncbi:hypothetical protein XH89_02560 [Bradyrhizobium sp. CCBAU 53340]|nr:hypothetical protein XH89_02560 [Bradyrhizobium sp. CCBAU 53340]